MLPRYGRTSSNTPEVTGTVFERLGGALAVIDQWTRVDANWLDAASRSAQDAVAYRGVTAAYRVAGLTIGDTDAAPMCPPFLVEIAVDRCLAQVTWRPEVGRDARDVHTLSLGALQHWAAGSLSKDLRVLPFEDGDIGLEAVMHLGPMSSAAVLREFVTAFSWDIAALHAAVTGGELLTTEEWVRRAALSISRATPTIPLRVQPTPAWPVFESPAGVFCSLQPGGGLAESDNVLYAVSRDVGALEPVVPMPGHRTDWDYARFIDVWLTRDGAMAFARSLLLDGFVHAQDAGWQAIDASPVTAVAPFGAASFLLGLHDGKVRVLDETRIAAAAVRLARVSGRFARLVTLDDRAIGICGTMLCSARLTRGSAGRARVQEAWSTPLVPDMSFDDVIELDVDRWSQVPAVAVLGDGVLLLVDAQSGRERSRVSVPGARVVRWIGPGCLLVVDGTADDGDKRAHVRVLDCATGRWSPQYAVAPIARLAVRGDEIHVGYANHTVAVWDRLDVCRVVGMAPVRTSSLGDHGTGAHAPAVPVDRPTHTTP